MPTAGVTIFGILNVTRDSFSDGGRFLDPAAAIEHAHGLVRDGADVVDIGAASSHPEAESVPADEEIRRLEPVVAELVRSGVEVSVDSWQPQVQRRALELGAAWLNDIRGFAEPSMYPVLASSTAGLVAMHSIGGGARATREVTDPERVYRGVIEFFDSRVAELTAAGIARGRLVLDPGMGLFLGADPEPSILVLQRLPQLCERYELPVLVSVSRKSLVGRLAGRNVDRRDAASLAAELFAVEQGATFIRTHEPRLLRDALAVRHALRERLTRVDDSSAFVMCIDNGGCPVSLEVRRIYRCKADAKAAEKGLLRVIDETGEDYLYPKELFEPVTMSAAARRRR